MKAGARTVGFDDVPHQRRDARVPIVGVVMRGAEEVEAVLRTDVTGDGDDATDAIAAAVQGCRAASNLVAILLQNVMVAGFNVIDLDALHARTGLPVVAVARGRLNVDAMRRAVARLPGADVKRARLDAAAARMEEIGPLTVAAVGIDGREVLARTTRRGHMPEPLRLAHLIGAGWVLGQSKGQ